MKRPNGTGLPEHLRWEAWLVKQNRQLYWIAWALVIILVIVSSFAIHAEFEHARELNVLGKRIESISKDL